MFHKLLYPILIIWLSGCQNVPEKKYESHLAVQSIIWQKYSIGNISGSIPITYQNACTQILNKIRPAKVGELKVILIIEDISLVHNRDNMIHGRVSIKCIINGKRTLRFIANNKWPISDNIGQSAQNLLNQLIDTIQIFMIRTFGAVRIENSNQVEFQAGKIEQNKIVLNTDKTDVELMNNKIASVIQNKEETSIQIDRLNEIEHIDVAKPLAKSSKQISPNADAILDRLQEKANFDRDNKIDYKDLQEKMQNINVKSDQIQYNREKIVDQEVKRIEDVINVPENDVDVSYKDLGFDNGI